MATLNLTARQHIANMINMVGQLTDVKTEMAYDLTDVKAYLDEHGIPEPKAKTEQGYRLRLLCPKWWRRTLNRKQSKDIEHAHIVKGDVRKARQIYCSDHTHKRAVIQAERNQKFMETVAMVSSDSEVIDMADIVRSSLANPYNRRSELMVRMAGFEIYAQELGYVGEFYTLTCPSKFHKYSGTKENPNYQGHTPKDAQQWLNEQWVKIRARFAKADLRPFGFRVVEPHHDGCPHWHMLLFMAPGQVAAARHIMSTVMLSEDGNEPGALQHRFKYVEIDSAIGTATGYIAKYISKNLGFSIDDTQLDNLDKAAEIGQRVKAWASCWGIRQFQQIGSAPVGVWRQLRKLHEVDEPELEEIRKAADESHWATYVAKMGGATAKRADMPVQLLKKKEVNEATGEMKQSAYCEILTIVYGLVFLTTEYIVKTKSFEMMKRTELIESLAGQGASAPPAATTWSPVINCN